MWLSNSSVGRKVIMALTGAFLVLFVTFHCLMNAVAIFWPTAYNAVCEFLGANWYALVASVVLAAFIFIHIIYAVILTVQNRRARGNVRYAISKTPKSVEWSSKNMLVLGIVIVAFLCVHMIQFWAKMQLAEVLGSHEVLPPAAGTLFLHEAFSQIWTPIVYIIGFVALWFHLNHGFWSMFQSIGWDNNVWIPRLKKIGFAWVGVVVALFVIQAIVFTVRSNEGYYLQNEALRSQYKEMIANNIEAQLGEDPQAAGIAQFIRSTPYDQVSEAIRNGAAQMKQQVEGASANPEVAAQMQQNPEMKKQFESMKKQVEVLENVVKLIDYLEKDSKKPELEMMGQPAQPQL